MESFESIASSVVASVRRRYHSHGDCDDAVQEALIRAWKDYESGKYEPKHIVNRSATWARKYLFPGSNAQKATGSTRVDTSGYVRNPQIREKIRLYMDEYIQLHGRKPSQVTVAKAIGISQSQVSYYLKKMATPGVETLKSKDQTRTDFGAYQMVELHNPHTENDDDYNSRTVQPSFEESLMDSLRFQEIVRTFEPEVRKALVLYYECDLTLTDVGWNVWPDSVTWVAAREKARRVLNGARKQLENELVK